MTREEAINIMNVIVHMLEEKYDTDRVEEAVEMAIKALEQEPTKEEKAILQKWRDNRGISIEDFENAMKALQQELCEDCISRQAVLDMVEDMTDQFGNKHRVVTEGMISLLPPVTPKPKWIPVSKRLPEPFSFVNCTCHSLIDDREDWVVETLYLPIPKEANKHGYSDWGNIPMLNWGEAEVIAWVKRIIPEPYKAESEDKE